MAVLDFKEIPEAHIATGEQDQFELFAREFLSNLGYKILSGPDRGADGGKDLVVEEKRVGVGGETCIRWLVSCKHKAHSGKSVSPQDESNIRDRVESNKSHGFIGFYSTLPSSGLAKVLKGLREKSEVQVFDNEKIERELLHSSDGMRLAGRFFPNSIERWKTENPKPAKIFSEDPKLDCEYCGKDLLNPANNGIIVIWSKIREDYEKPEEIEHIYWSCKGHCDQVLSAREREEGLIDGWEDIPDVMMPIVFIRWVLSPLNEIHAGTKYSDEAFKKLKEFILNVYPYVARHVTSQEKERIKSLMEIPSYLGGLGY
ncbi:restriction endonuclease [Methylocaldum gracile]|jgi:hypothetical protein|uniref:restriction endonuclease n=1 Tax=Methylocaldum sp. 0917 TaxID=2485163 RepID=UPI00105EA038